MPVLVQQKVLRLQVSVHHVHPVDLLHAIDDLSKKTACLVLWDANAIDYVVEKLPARGILHD
jgi:hypothetical protein